MDIKDLAKKYNLDKSDFWEMKYGGKSNWIITHDAVEKIADIEKIIFHLPQIFRDTNSNAIVNTSTSEYKIYMQRVKAREKQSDQIRNVVKDINNLKMAVYTKLSEVKLKEFFSKFFQFLFIFGLPNLFWTIHVC